MKRTRTPRPKPAWFVYIDAPLAAFVAVLASAAMITSHGTYVFYSYILSPQLALAATLVLTVGIPLLELAAVLDERGRWGYIAGLVLLLGMEGFAQYLQGQASFTRQVLAQFPDPTGVDVATWAQAPEGRILPIVYLALLSFVVVGFGFAASARIRYLRTHAQRIVRFRGRPRELRRLVRKLARQVREARQIAAQIQAQATQAINESAQIRDHAAHGDQQLAQAQQAAAQLHRDNAQLRAQLAQLTQELAQARADQALDPLVIAQELMAHDVSLRKAAQIVGWHESTLRTRIKARTNGHKPEEVVP